MTNEIKEILDRLERIDHKAYNAFDFADCADFDDVARCFDERKKLADHITNLQEENEHLKMQVECLLSKDKPKDKMIEKLALENEKLKNGYCELKIKCNNGECDCTNEEYNGMVQANMKLSLEIDKLTAESTEWENKFYELQEENERLKDTMAKIKDLNTMQYLRDDIFKDYLREILQGEDK